MRVTVDKSLPGDDALPSLPHSEAIIVWWKRVFEGDPEIDVCAIPDRKANHQALEKHKQVALALLPGIPRSLCYQASLPCREPCLCQQN